MMALKRLRTRLMSGRNPLRKGAAAAEMLRQVSREALAENRGEMRVIRMASEFSPRPEGISSDDETYPTATRLREDFLVPALEKNTRVVVDLDGLYYTPSAAFLKEAFGGLVSINHREKEDLFEQLAFVATRDEAEKEVNAQTYYYIKNATKSEKTG